jgi:signal transduction histidine kinase
MFAETLLRIDLHTAPLLILGLIVLGYNSLLFFVCRSADRTVESAWRVAWGQILLDWLAMTALVHFTGGITSPALIYFVIHAALSGLVLLPWYTRGLALLAVIIVGGLAWLERMGTLAHVAISEFGLGALYRNETYMTAILFFFGTTVFTLSELVSRNAQRLRQREEHIRQLYEARATFVRVATHELRAPLAAGISLMHNLEQGYAGEFNPRQTAILHRVLSRLKGLSSLIDDLLELATSREASLSNVPLEPVEIGPVLASLIEREMPNAQEKHITVNAQLSGDTSAVMAGNDGLGIIFGNLLNNAIKYTPEGGQVTVDCAVNRHDQTVEIRFTDTGIGIPADELPRIFSEFFRARNAKALQVNGSGIGLSAVRALVEHYHGAITLHSEEGRGTTVQVTLPLAARPASSSSHAQQAPPKPS